MEISETADFKYSSKELRWTFRNLIFLHVCKVLFMIQWLLPVADDVTLGFLHSVTLISTVGNSTRQWNAERCQKACAMTYHAQTCWEHRHYVMPDRVLLHQNNSSSLFVRLLNELEDRCCTVSQSEGLSAAPWRPSGENKLLAHRKMT